MSMEGDVHEDTVLDGGMDERESDGNPDATSHVIYTAGTCPRPRTHQESVLQYPRNEAAPVKNQSA